MNVQHYIYVIVVILVINTMDRAKTNALRFSCTFVWYYHKYAKYNYVKCIIIHNQGCELWFKKKRNKTKKMCFLWPHVLQPY